MPGGSCATGCEPPVWISVVGSRGAWPLEPSQQVEAAGDYVQKLTVPDDPQPGPTALETYPSPAFLALFVVVTAMLALIGLDLTVLNGRWATLLFGRGWANANEETTRRYAFAAAGIASLATIETILAAIWSLHVHLGGAGSPVSTALASVGWIVAVVCLLPLAVMDIQLVGRVAWHGRAWRARLLSLARHDGLLWWLGGAGIAVWSAVNLAEYAWTRTTVEPPVAASFVARAMELGNGVSPVLPIVFLCTAFVIWAIAELMRLRGAGAPLNDPDVQKVMKQVINGRLERVTDRWKELGPSILSVPWSLAWIVIVAVASTCIGLFDPFVRPLVTIEGSAFGSFVAGAILLQQAMIGLALLQFIRLWSVLKSLLERLVHSAGANAYTKVPRGLFPAGLFPRTPTVDDLEPLVACREASLTKNGDPDAGRLRQTLERELKSHDGRAWSSSPTWQDVLAALTAAQSADGRLRPIDYDTIRLREMCVTLVVRDAIARLWHNLIFIIGAMLCVFCSHTLFPFQMQKALEIVGWIFVALAFGAVLRVLLQMRGNEFLRRVAAPDPAKDAGWDSAFILRLAIFVLVPLLTLFAAQFPEVGGLLMRFVDPVRKILP